MLLADRVPWKLCYCWPKTKKEERGSEREGKVREETLNVRAMAGKRRELDDVMESKKVDM